MFKALFLRVLHFSRLLDTLKSIEGLFFSLWAGALRPEPWLGLAQLGSWSNMVELDTKVLLTIA